MKKNVGIIISLCIGLLLSITFISCKATKAKGAESSVKLVVWIAGTGEVVYDKSYRIVLDAFCKDNPHVSYELSFIPWPEYFTKLNTGLIGGAGPDLFMLGYGQFGVVQNNGNLLPLNDYIPKNWDGYEDFHENILKVGQKDSVYYALFNPSTRVFLYRKDIAEQNGVTEEDLHIKSMEDLFALARKMTVYDSNNNVKVYGLEIDPDQEQTLFVYSSMLTDNFHLWNDDLTAAFDNQYAYDAYRKIYQFSKEGIVTLLDPASMTPKISLGVSAIALSPENFYAPADAAFPGKIGIVKSDMNTLLIGNFIAVNKKTKNPEVAAKALLYMFSKESAKVFQDVASQYTGRKSLDDEYIKKIPEMKNAVYAYSRSYPYSYALNPKYTATVQQLRSQLDAVFQGEDAQKSISKAAEEWNKIVSELK